MRWLLVVFIAFAVTTARADEPAPTSLRFPVRVASEPDEPPEEAARGPVCDGCDEVSTRRRVLATIVAASPVGLIARGVGSWMVHDKHTAKQLLKVYAVGVGLAVVGGVPAGVSGGNPYLLIPFVPMLVAGTGLIMQSWFADIYTAAGVEPHGVPRARVPWSLETGTAWTHDAYRDRLLWRSAARVSTGRLELTGTAYAGESLGSGHEDGEYREGDLAIGVRVLGAPATGEVIDDGSYVLVRATGRVRDDTEDNVQVATIEADVVGRLDLRHISDALTGSFAELSTGGGLERAAFRTASEKGGILLGRFAYGMYLGRRGEAQLYYDHRRDSFAGGIAAYRAAGFVGSVGAMVDARLTGRWGMHAELEIGSAWVSSIGLRYQGGPP